MWTLEQSAAIELRNCDLLVSAAAGSGKTAVLVERITKLVLVDQVPVDQMLIVTYTNAAAGEMRSRIERALSEQMNTSSHNRFLQDQLKRLNRAHIKTFHAFCLDVVRQNFQKIEIDPAFRMANESELQVLIHQALEKTLEAFYEAEDPAFVKLVESYSGNRDDVKLREIILSLYRFIQSQSYPLVWLEDQGEAYRSNAQALCESWLEMLESDHKNTLKSGVALLQHAIGLCQPIPELEGYMETLTLDLQGFESMLEVSGDAFAERVANYKFAKLKALRKEAKEAIDPELIEEIKTEIRDKYIKKKIFEKISEFYQYKTTTRYYDEVLEQSQLIDILVKIVTAFTEGLDALKRKRNVLDFNDLEHFAVALLDDDDIAKQYKSQFQYIFVDEYQDASGIQEKIISRIKRENALFMVGDIKQSIYKFRLADPQIFVDKYKRFKKISEFGLDEIEKIPSLNERFKTHGEPRQVRIDLKQNFRTRDLILEAVNRVFEPVMQPPLGEIAYDDDARLNPGMVFEPPRENTIEVNLIGKDSETNDDFFEDMKNDEIEARAAVLKIKDLIGRPLYHPKRKVWAPCQYKDIVMLIRSVRSWTPIFETVFMEEGIPLYADNPSGYFDTLEIKFVLALLKVVANPLDDLAMLTVLRSPVVGLTISEIIEIKQLTPARHYLFEGIVQGVEGAFSEPSLGGHLREKLQSLLSHLQTWRKASEYTMLDIYLWSILKESGLYDACIAMPGGAARAANLSLLIDRASELRQSQIVSLNEFIHFIEALKEASGDMGVANTIGENDDVVRLMSIHKSKGLEFPVVMMMGMGRKINLMDTYGDLLLHKDIGMAISYVDLDKRTRSKTLPQWAIRSKIQMETFAEELRVLYVGLTRPVDKLILFGTFPRLTKKQNEWEREAVDFMFQNPSCYMDWIMPNWSRDPKVVTQILDSSHFETQSLAQNTKWKDRMVQWQRISQSERVVSTKDKVFEVLNAKYPDRQSYTPSKTSVTEMQRGFVPPTLAEAPAFLGSKKITGAEKGTLTHAYLERLDLTRTYTLGELDHRLNQFIEAGIFTSEEAKVIDLSKILAFMSTPLGISIRNYSIHHHETPFILKRETQLIQGVIDLYVETDEGLILIDFKTDYKRPNPEEPVWLKYKDQLGMYTKALETLTGRKVIQQNLVFLMTGEVVEL